MAEILHVNYSLQLGKLVDPTISCLRIQCFRSLIWTNWAYWEFNSDKVIQNRGRPISFFEIDTDIFKIFHRHLSSCRYSIGHWYRYS